MADQITQDVLNQNKPTDVNIPPELDAASLNNAKDLNIPEPVKDDTSQFISGIDSGLENINKFLGSILAGDSTQQITEERTGLEAKLAEELGKLTGKGTSLVAQEKALGIPEQTKQLMDVTTQIAQRRGEFDKAITAQEGKVIPIEFITGRQAQLRRQQAVELGSLAAVGQAMIGNIQLAQQQAQRTVDLEYAPVEQEIANIREFLELNQEDFTNAEKKEAQKLTIALNERQRILDNEKENKNKINDIAIAVAKNGGGNDLISKIIKSGDVMDAIRVAGNKLADPVDNKPIVVAPGSSLYDPLTGEFLGQAPVKPTDVSGPPKTQNINGTTYQWNEAIGGWEKIQLPIDPQVTMTLQENADLAKELLGLNYESITGIRGIKTRIPGFGGEFTKAKAVAQNLVDKISLENRSQLKGQGQISDFEGRMLANASSLLSSAKKEDGTYELSNQDFATAVEDIRRAFLSAKNYQLYSHGEPIDLESFLQGADDATLERSANILESNPEISDDELLIQLIPKEWNLGFTQSFNNVGGDTNQATGFVPQNIKIGAGLAVVNNNPGNLRFIGQRGATQGKGGFAKFSSPQAGYQALIDDLNAKKAPGGNLGPQSTLQELVFVYAPPSENASQQYVEQIAKMLGVSANTPIGQIDTFKLAKAIAKKESSTTIS